MKTIYETFYDLADHFRSGYSSTHTQSKHTPEECVGWQEGIIEFAEWLDENGYQLKQKEN